MAFWLSLKWNWVQSYATIQSLSLLFYRKYFTATGIRTQISSSDDVGRLMLLIPIQYVLIASPSVGTYLAALADLNA